MTEVAGQRGQCQDRAHRRDVIDANDEVQIVVLPGLLSDERVDAPPALEPGLDLGVLEAFEDRLDIARARRRHHTAVSHVRAPAPAGWASSRIGG